MHTDESSGGWLGKAIAVIVVWVVLAGAGYYFFMGARPAGPAAGPGDPAAAPTASTGPAQPGQTPATAPDVEIGIAYGTEKRQWLEWAVTEFQKTPDGQHVRVKLLPMGSQEGARAVLAGDERIHVWSPASSLYKPVFLTEWQVQHTGQPIASEESLALTPMVFVVWRERAEAFLAKYKELNFRTVADALHASGGWGGIAGKPEWGLFKFGHTHPNQSNSGLMTLVLMAYDFHQRTRSLSRADTVQPELQSWIVELERGVSGLSNSTGNLTKEMILKGPSSYDAVFVYESTAIEYLQSAEGRWGPLQVIYPPRNLWCDNPYYVLDVPWSKPAHRAAAERFLAYLMSEPVQMRALTHGFRPGNPKTPIKFPESPFLKFADHGLKIDLTTVCEPPGPDVIQELLTFWQRAVTR